MKPKGARTKKDWCKDTCPYMVKWEHPFWHHTAWCEYLLKELRWYDGAWLCHCKREEPASNLLKITGRTNKSQSL
jgi:hypothetical protein